MEIALRSEMHIYSGGPGVLAGDNLELPMIAVTLISRQDYFKQRLDGRGHRETYPMRDGRTSMGYIRQCRYG